MSSVFTWLTFVLLFFISPAEKYKAITIVTKALAIVLGISLIAWVVHNYVFSLPQFGTLQYTMQKNNTENIILNNYIVFIQYDNDYINRFYGIFDEPGVVGTLSAFLIYINGYNFRNAYVWPLFLAGVCTFSLAFVVLFVLGWVIVNSNNIFTLFKLVLGLIIISATAFVVFKDNYTFQHAILERIVDIEGRTENRFSHQMNTFFEEYITTPQALIGKGTSYIAENSHIFTGQGYRFFLIEYGVIGVVIVLFMYLSMMGFVNRLTVGLLILFFVSFVQRPFLFTPWQLILFSTGVEYINHKKYLEKKQC